MGTKRNSMEEVKSTKSLSRVCTRVCCHLIYSGRRTCGRTSREVTQEEGPATGGRSHKTYPPSFFCGACFNFYREKDSAVLFPRRP